ncbi:MAG TPA: hypothetical protein VGR20_24895 [Acidimicrobiia bacterium]|jgi:hypothetical protein|nr:hypothetical protein [Acidimicrobiia bacterium]
MTEMRPRRAALIVLSAVLLTAAACSKDKKETPTTTSAPTTTSTEATTTTVALTKESIVLAPDGLGTLTFGTNAARTINLLMQALGQPEKNTPLPVGTPCGATRRLTWGNFQVLLNEVGASSGAGKPGFAGWFLGATSPNKLDFKTEKGITIGSTVAALKAAYGADVTVAARGEQGPGFTVSVPKGILLGLLDSANDTGKIKNIQSGSYCGAA